MDETPTTPVTEVKPAIPAPDIPPPSISPPAQTPGSQHAAAPPPMSGAPVRIDVTEDAGDDGSPAGSIAPFNTRIIAGLIDMVVAVGLQILVQMILPHFASRISWLVGLGYLVARDSLPFLGGQSVGKKAMKLKVVTEDGRSLVNLWEPALIRNAVLAIPLFGFVEFIVLLTREGKPERGRRLGDEWSKTRVILAADPPANG